MQQQMKPICERQNYTLFKNSNLNSLYSFTVIDDEPEKLLELSEIFLSLQYFHDIYDQISPMQLQFPEPVYVIKEGDREEIRYNSATMELNKIYEIEWNDKQYGLRKTDKEVEILRFYPDEK